MLLAIETSCDETSVSLLDTSILDITCDISKINSPELKFKDYIKSCEVYSQDFIHKKFGGVVPEVASREHLVKLPVVLNQAINKAGSTLTDIQGIAVTSGPGLKGCLLVGVCFARGLAASLNIPLIDVNHIEGHLWSPFIDHIYKNEPFLSVIVSGGHTQIVEVRGFDKYEIIASTRDDAAGEAFDKCAKILGIPYPGGAALSRLADSISIEESPYKFPIGMSRDPSSFSYSGLKTAFMSAVSKVDPKLLNDEKPKLAVAIQEAIVQAVVKKTISACKSHGILNVGLCGGVAANSRLRGLLAEEVGKLSGNLYVPSFKYCTDNAAMIGVVGYMKLMNSISPEADFDPYREIEVRARWPLAS